MSFNECWHTLLDACEELSDDATLVAPLSERRFRVTDVQDDRFIIAFTDSDSSRPLPQDQLEALYDRVTDAPNGFALENLPRGTEPYAAVLSLHPRYEVDERAGVITKRTTIQTRNWSIHRTTERATGRIGRSQMWTCTRMRCS